MIDTKVIEYVDKCNENTVKTVTAALDSRFKSLTELIAVDNQNIKDKIKEVRDHVEKQNGSIGSLKEWKAGIEGGQNRVKNMTPWITIIIAVLMLGFTLYNNNRVNNIKQEQLNLEWSKKDKDLSDISPVVRGGVELIDSI